MAGRGDTIESGRPVGRRPVLEAIAGAASGALSGLSGCIAPVGRRADGRAGATGTASKERVSLEYVDVAGERDGVDFDPVVRQLEDDFDVTIDLTYTEVPYENLRSTLLTRVGGGNAPDIAAIDQVWLGAFVSGGTLLALDEVADDIDFDDYLDEFAAVVQHDGRVYGLPIGTDVRGMYWNKQRFEAAGLDPERPPETWSELVDVAAQVHDPPETYGTSYFVNPGRWTVCLFSAGGAVLNDDRTEPRFHQPPGVRAAEFVDRLYNEDDVSTPQPAFGDSSQAAREFLQGQSAISVVEGSWLDYFWRNLGHDGRTMPERFGFAPTPRPADGATSTMSGGFVWAGFRSTDHPRLVRAFLRLVSERPFVERLMAETGDIPTRESLLDAPAIWDQVLYADQVRDLLQRTRLRPVEHWPVVEEALETALQRIAFDRQDPRPSLETAAEEVRARLR